MLSEAAAALAGAGALQPALLSLAERVVGLMGGRCEFRLLSDDGGWLRPCDASASLPADGPSLEAEVARLGEPRFETDTPLAVVPIQVDQRTAGTLGVSGGRAGGYTAADQVFLKAVAVTAALAIGSFRRCERMQDELARTTRLKEEFLATLSHELRTPLNAVLGWVHLLRGSRADPAIFERAVETIERNTLAQARLISDLLDVSNIVAGKQRLAPEPVDFASLVHEVVETLGTTAAAKRISLDVALDPGSGAVRGDLARLRQAVWSLVANAVKFTPKDGRVRVSVRAAGAEVVLRVEDSGPGIPPEFLPHVFEGFRQADASPSRQQGGLGLGLALARHLVELHGGSIAAQSFGEGAVFTVRLPRIGSLEDAQAAGYAPETLPALEGVRILLVDGDADVRETLGNVLGKRGALVDAVATADAAVEAVRARAPHAIVADIGLPDADGYELIHRIRALPPGQGGSVPAVAITPYAGAKDRIRALLAGYQMHVPKPVNPLEVGVAVAHVLRAPAAP